jgi:hypothetical protein
MERLIQICGKLNTVSVKNFNNPYLGITWPETINFNEWFHSPELTSLYGTEIYNKLSEEDKKKLSFYECVNFFSLNIHGERELIAGLALRLYKHYPPEITDYIHHFLDEENKHMLWFGTFCNKYAGKVYRNKKMFMNREYAQGEEEILFFSKVLIFEEIVDYFNVAVSRDERVMPLARRIQEQHHIDESRHLSFGREILLELFRENRKKWSGDTEEKLAEYLKNYMISTWKEYYNPDVYRDLKLEKPVDVLEMAWNSAHSKDLRTKASKKCHDFLLQNDLLKKEIIW